MPDGRTKKRGKGKPRKKSGYPVAKKYYKYGASVQTIGNRLSNLSDTTVVKLRYVDSVSLNPIVGTPASWVMSASSIYDPNNTGGGHQPMGHDQWAQLYGRYVVLGSTCKVIAISSAGSGVATDSAILSVIVQRNNSTSIVANTDLLEQRRGNYTIMPIATSGNGRAEISAKYDASKFWGIREFDNSADQYSAQFGVSPIVEAFFHVSLSPLSSSYDVGATLLYFFVEYTCRLSSPINLTQS